MKISIETKKFQNLLNKSMKGASQNKNYPLSNLLCIESKDGTLKLLTTDMDNYLLVEDSIDDSGDFYVVVGIEIFYKLISKLTCEYVTLEIKDGNLNVVGNGKYIIELPLNEEGELIRFPNPIESFSKLHTETSSYSIGIDTISKILNTAKYAISQDNSSLDKNIICYSGYYFSDRVITTDGNVMCCINEPIFDTPALISTNLMELLGLFTETVDVIRDDTVALFESDNISVFGVFMDKEILSEYKIDDILPLFDLEYGSSCKVLRSEFMQVLDRLSLFVGPYDDGQIRLIFSDSNISVESKQSNSEELIKYISSTNISPFLCNINVDSLYSQVKSFNGETIEIYFGIENAIKFVSGNTIQIIALEE